jgi:signal transduction histidine kinase
MAQPFIPIRDSSVLLSDIVHEVPARIWVKDSEGRYVFVNQHLANELKIDRETWIGSTDDELFPAVGHIYWRKDLQVLSTQKPLVTTDQAENQKYIFVLRFPLSIEGRPHVVGVGVETTEQVSVLLELFRLRDEAFRNERLRAIGEMASAFAHDVGNSLNNANLVLLLAKRKAGENLQGDLASITRSIGAASDRVHALREFLSARNQEQMEPTNLRDVIREAIAMVGFLIEKTPTANGAFIKLECSIPDSMPTVVGPPNQLKHVFSNLMLNARDAMPDGGTLRIEARPNSTGVEIVVADEGTGIDAALMEKIFDPFFTTKDLGNGLGLSMARDVMSRLRGTISASNRDGKGAQFVLTFPVAGPPARPDTTGSNR